MGKTYNLSKKTDVNKFVKDMEKELAKQVKRTKFDFVCPSCSRKLKVKVGQNKCPHCNAALQFNVNL